MEPELRRLIADWNEGLVSRTAATSAARETFARVVPAVRARFAETMRDPRLQEAVLLNSPDMLVNGLRPFLEGRGTPAAQRQREAALVSYLQRFCARADTASFYGPIDFGGYDGGVTTSVDYRWPPTDSPPRRRVFLSHWAAEELAVAIQRDDRTRYDQRPVRSALVRVAGTGVIIPSTGARASLTALERTLLERADGLRSIRDIARGAGAELEEVDRVAGRLANHGLLQLGFRVHAHELDSFAQIEAVAASLTEPSAAAEWTGTCARIRSILREFEHAPGARREQLLADLEAVFQEVTCAAPRRGGGQLYADRLVLYEECSGEVRDLTIGGPLLAALERALETSLDLLGSTALRVWQSQAESAHEELRAALPDGRPMPFLRFLWECEREPRAAGSAASPFTQKTAQGLDWWRRVWDSLVPDPAERSVALTGADLERAFGGFEAAPGFVAAIDLMVAAESPEAIARGEYQIVLSEVHPVLLATHKAMTVLHPDLDGLLRRGQEVLDELLAPEQQAILSSRRISKIDSWLIGRPLIELEWMDTALGGDHVAVADLDAHVSRELLPHLRTPSVAKRLQLEMPLVTDASFPATLWAFGRPAIWHRSVDRGRHTPRIEVDGLVFQRERWTVPGEELPVVRTPLDCFDNLLALWRWKDAVGLPDAVYWVALQGADTKPALLDFHSPLSCFTFIRRIAGRPPVLLSEMLPGPDGLWLRNDAGLGYVCELRFNAWQPAPPRPPEPDPEAAAGIPDGPHVSLEALGEHLAELRRVVGRLVTED